MNEEANKIILNTLDSFQWMMIFLLAGLLLWIVIKNGKNKKNP